MRPIPHSTTPALRLARRLQRALEMHLPGIKLSHCQGLAARLVGYRDWHELAASVGGAGGQYDEETPPREIALRFDRQIAILVEAGLPRKDAERLIQALRPTARSQRRPETFDVVSMIESNEPEDMDYADLGFHPPDGWLDALSAPSGVLVLSGATGSGKSVLARATLKEIRARRGSNAGVVIYDGCPLDDSQLDMAFGAASDGLLAITTMHDAHFRTTLPVLRRLCTTAPGTFLGLMRMRTVMKPEAVGEHRPCLYDGYAHPEEAAKREYKLRWIAPGVLLLQEAFGLDGESSAALGMGGSV